VQLNKAYNDSIGKEIEKKNKSKREGAIIRAVGGTTCRGSNKK
jgi:hypothetical protein